jgi:hypothetical protein
MSKTSTQSLKNHARLDPAFHMVLALIILLNLIYSIIHLVRHVSWRSGWFVVLSAAAIIVFLKIREYPIKVQDRVIRLEERLRMQRVLPETLKGRITELTEGQCVALRFASDAELPALVEKTLGGNLKQKQIKQAIQTWRPDYFRV